MNTHLRLSCFSEKKAVFAENSEKKSKIYLPVEILFSNKVKLLFFFLSVSGLFFFLLPAPVQKTQEDAFNLGEKDIFQSQGPVLLSGNTLMPVSESFNPEPKIVKKFPVIITAYSSTPWETWGDPFVTAAGTSVRDGIIANNYLPFGTRVRMPEIYGDKVFIVEDRMNSRKGNYHFDIWFPSHCEAKEFGAKTTYIEVLES